jgi:hypothetical protein
MAGSGYGIGKDVKRSGSGLTLKYYPGICLQKQRKSIKIFIQDGWYRDRINKRNVTA